MAKKKVIDEEEELLEEDDAAEVGDDEEAEEEEVEEEEPADDDDGGGADEPSEDRPAKPPRAKLHWMTIVLIFLNWIAAGAFVYLLVMDYQVRQQWTYAVFRNYLTIWGLPLADEENSLVYH